MKRIRLVIILIIAVVIISTGIWWLVNSASSETSTDTLTSGFIEAKDVAVALEVSGRITDITVKEGDSVEAGKVLVRLDDSTPKAQEKQAEANMKLAQAYLQQAIVSRDGAKKAWEDALDVQRNPLELDATIIAAQGELDIAELNLKQVKEIEYNKDIENKWKIATAEVQTDTAQKILENLKSFNPLGVVSSYYMNKEIYPAEGELAKAKLNLKYHKEWESFWSIPSAELRRDNAQKALRSLLAIKNNPQEINAAVDQSYTAYQIAVAAVETAKRQLEQAEASLKVIEVQLDKFTCSSPIYGVVAKEHAEVGEIAKPGAPILTITELDKVTLTAYVPESKIGLVKLGQQALVFVDSYPADSFSGKVVYISPQAQFTPRNVQLKEEREKTVFAVKIRLANPQQKLKPGMPADARILTNSQG